MKKYITILLLLLFISCRAPLKVTDSQEVKVTDKTQVATAETQESKSEAKVSTSTTSERSENIVTTTKVTEYDTDKPVNPDTGKPPVKRETETTQTASRGKKAQEHTASMATDTTAVKKTDDSKKDVQLAVEQVHAEERQLPGIVWWAVSIVAVGVLVLIFWSKISGYFSKIGGWIKGLF